MIEGEPFIISVPGYHRPSYESDSCPGPNIITLELDSSFAIASPMYGISNYGNNLNCTWQITAPEGMVSGTSQMMNLYLKYFKITLKP